MDKSNAIQWLALEPGFANYRMTWDIKLCPIVGLLSYHIWVMWKIIWAGTMAQVQMVRHNSAPFSRALVGVWTL